LRDNLLAETIGKQQFSREELQDVEQRIYGSEELAREISYAGAITPGLFARAREMSEVVANASLCACGNPSVMRVLNHPQAGNYCNKCADEL